MIKPDQIPDEVVKAALLTDERLGMRTVIAAALNAWPGSSMENRELFNFGNNIDGPIISTSRVPFYILPQKPEGRIDQEKNNDL